MLCHLQTPPYPSKPVPRAAARIMTFFMFLLCDGSFPPFLMLSVVNYTSGIYYHEDADAFNSWDFNLKLSGIEALKLYCEYD